MRIDVDKMRTGQAVKELRLCWLADSWKNTQRNELGMTAGQEAVQGGWASQYYVAEYVISNAATASREDGRPALAIPLFSWREYTYLGTYVFF